MKARRTAPNVVPQPSVGCRASCVETPPTDPRRATRPAGARRAGMTLIELGIVIGIVSVLLALVLGLNRHVNEVIKVRRAQADLGEWHEALHAWHVTYGTYPDPAAPPMNNSLVESNLVWLASTDPNPSRSYREAGAARPFSAYLSRRLPTRDPWGIPYFYRSFTNTYELLSCGPNTLHLYTTPAGAAMTFPRGSPVPADASRLNDDDIRFEP